MPPFAVVVLALFLLRANNERMGRPLEYDECLTIWNHNWVGVHPTGERNPTGRIETLYALPRPGLRQVIIESYCAIGRWIEPNNHINNSMLVNVALVIGPPSESTARWHALFGALLFCMSLYCLARLILRLGFAPLSVALLGWFLPYVDHVGQTARGYTWMLALQTLGIISAYWLNSRPLGLLPFTAFLVTMVATVLNTS
jgi:hypothetical protein